jgi:hypothetical protein
MIGFIKLNRQILNWEWYDDIPIRLTFFHLLLKANWEDKNWKGIEIKRGQILTGSIETPKEIGITRPQFRRAIKLLKRTNEITTKATNKNTLVTIVNYDKFQDSEKEKTNKKTINTTNKEPSKDHQKTTTKEDNNIITKEIKKRESEKSLTPLEIIKSDLSFWETFQMQNKRHVDNWEKMLLDFQDMVNEKELKYDFKVLSSRLSRWCRNWRQNQNKYKSTQEEKSTQINNFYNNLEKA